MLQLTAFCGGFVSSKGTVKSHSTEMLQLEQIMRGKEHWPPKCVVRPAFSLFTCLATAQQRLITSPRDPGAASLHVNASHFSTTARRVTSPTWGPPPPCKQALKRKKIFRNEIRHSSVFWKAFQISTNYFSFHRHFNENHLWKCQTSKRHLYNAADKIIFEM